MAEIEKNTAETEVCNEEVQKPEMTNKRPLDGEGKEESEAKISRLSAFPIDLQKQIAVVDEELKSLETKCREEQIAVQCKFEKNKKQHFEKRQELINQIPHFWKHCIFSYFGGGTTKSSWIAQAEMPIFDYLEKVDIDFLGDKYGSHKFIFQFGENEYFDNKVFVKTIKIEDEEKPITIINEPDNFDWKKNPFQEGNEAQYDMSFFCWLLNRTDDERTENFGSLFKDNVWEDAITIFNTPQREEEEEEGYDQSMDDEEYEEEGDYEEENEYDEEMEEGEEGEGDNSPHSVAEGEEMCEEEEV